MNRSPDAIRKMFAACAPRYDLLNRLLTCGIDQHWRRRAVRAIASRLRENSTVCDTVLDVGTGTGDFAFALHRGLAPHRAVGIDFVPEMLAIAEAKRLRLGYDAIEFCEGDALSLPVESGSCSVAATAFGIRNTADTDVALREMVRVVCPRGVVAVLEFAMPTAPVVSQLYGFYFHKVLPFLGRCIAGRAAGAGYRYLPASVVAFDNAERMVARMTAAGLTDVAVFPMTFSVVNLYLGSVPLGHSGSLA
ncbi:MAG: ubiquinone/menaquinone biosynthesis methyltransferase [Thermoguttaceae bacterium]